MHQAREEQRPLRVAAFGCTSRYRHGLNRHVGGRTNGRPADGADVRADEGACCTLVSHLSRAAAILLTRELLV